MNSIYLVSFYINDDISVEDGNKMIKELNNVIELFNKSISKVTKD